ncbi:uncharacterized protein J4E92_002828 [Alternaria infectoria]|uniref:uncharacterized protein n=1 Tax=Alternaria infectoria TaxID=45303 RepID=UPI002220E45D|nr:uncharacterized protein J4E92_002828 [Alternaria infectoria]KAI4935537.1 hypothetical protein J4E92_002828 [Alternaria infectoria]
MDLVSVTVRVGEADASVDIVVYRNILSAVSPYFRSAFEGSFVEATDRLISLTDVTEQTFRMFLRWTQIQAHNNQLPSGTIVPPPAILVPNSTTQHGHATATGPAELQPPHPARSGPNAETLPDTTRALDEPGYHQLTHSEDTDKLYFENPEWFEGYCLSLLSFLRLYVFADKYNVPQLRDDVLTAVLAQSISWNWWPDIEQGVIQFAYANLPSSSKFIRFLVISTAFVWLSQDGNCSATKLRILRELNEDFAFDVTVVQFQRLKTKKTSEGVPLGMKDAVTNSCALHEHLVQDAEQCRKRIHHQPYIFTGLMEMCAQAALAMKKESDKE